MKLKNRPALVLGQVCAALLGGTRGMDGDPTGAIAVLNV